jgi:hypothetical protein
MANDMQDSIQIAVQGTEIKHLQNNVDRLIVDMVELKASIADISKTLAEARGGWHTLMVIGSMGAVLGSVVGWAIEHFGDK